ncbi:hypothetical protein AB0M52_32040, partial [Micromonospora sp. NPDC051296]
WSKARCLAALENRLPEAYTVDLDVPVNVTARVALPVEAGKSYRAAGPSKATFVGIENGRAVFEVGSGRSSFRPVAGTAAQPR